MGHVYRQAPSRLMFDTVTAFYDLHMSPRMAKGTAYDTSSVTTATARTLVNATDRDLHKRKRRVFGPIVGERSMRLFEPAMLKHETEFTRQLHSYSSRCGSQAPVANMSELLSRMALDIACELGFGFALKTQSEEINRHLFHTFDNWSWRINMQLQSTLFRVFGRWLFQLYRSKAEVRAAETVRDMAITRLKQDKGVSHDLFSLKWSQNEEDKKFFESDIWTEGATILLAGSATTAATMCATVFYLSRYPACYKKVAEEIRSSFASVSEIKLGSQLNGCSYLRACIEESLRCTPPVITPLWRQQDLNEDSNEPFVVDGEVIPRGTQVAVPLYSLFHNGDLFPDPFVYDPGRWMELPDDATDGEKESHALMRKALVPFVVGERSCVGKPMAWAGLMLTLARLFWFFDFEKAPGKAGDVGEKLHPNPSRGKPIPEYIVKDVYVTEHDGPNLVLKVRPEVAAELEAELAG